VAVCVQMLRSAELHSA